MAFCVHCGVRLGEGETRCPLCGIVSVDPLSQEQSVSEKPYPSHTPEQELRRGKRFFLSLICMMLLTPAAVCLLCDFIPNGNLTWSLYPICALVLLFLTFLPPILVDTHKLLYACLTALVTLNVYLFLVERFSHTEGWFFPIALPAVLAAALMIGIIVLLRKLDKLNKISLLATVLLANAIECLLVEILCSNAISGTIAIHWSWFAFIPSLILSICFYAINANRPLREEFRRRLRF